MLGHDPRSPSEDHPGQQGAEDRITDTGPGGGDTEAPAELSGVADEDDGREIGGTVGECRQPWTYGAASQNKSFHISCMLSAVESDADQYGKVDDQNNEFHNFFPFYHNMCILYFYHCLILYIFSLTL